MSSLNIEFMDDTIGFYSKVEDDLESAVKHTVETCAIETCSNDVFYHTSDLRHAILSWYPFKKDCTILEIGAGMGALTGLFCKHAKQVFAVEKKKSRANIIRDRFADKINLQVINDNIFNVTLNQQVDYVILGDTFSYARKFIKSHNAQIDLLRKIRTFLKPDGIILLSTENRLGLKYFSGAVENYSHKFFTGLNEFEGYDIIRTFSKNELLDLCIQSDLPFVKFYYPYPDNIFPMEIYTDECLSNGIVFGAKLPDRDIETERFNFFDEQKLFRTLQKEGVVSTFTNAFLLEISSQVIETKISYTDMTDNLAAIEQRYYPKYFPNFIYPVDVVELGDVISSDSDRKYHSQEQSIQEKTILDLLRQPDIYSKPVDSDIIRFIDKRMLECEKQYNIKILFWTGRGSVASGVFRKNSDLDLGVIYKSLGNKVSAIHDIIGYGFDFWGWDIEDALTAITQSEPLSKEHHRGGLNYYYGLYCTFGCFFTKDYDGFLSKTQETFMLLYDKKRCIAQILPEIHMIIDNKNNDGKLSYADYLNLVEYVLCCKHFLDDGLPGDVHIRKLMIKYMPDNLHFVIIKMLESYLTSLRKHSQLVIESKLDSYIIDEVRNIQEKFDALEYKMLNNDALLELRRLVE